MNQQVVFTEKYTILQRTEKIKQILNGSTFKHIMFSQKYKKMQLFCGCKILTEGVFVTQLANNLGISA